MVALLVVVGVVKLTIAMMVTDNSHISDSSGSGTSGNGDTESSDYSSCGSESTNGE